jgi:hypothetical protein
LHKLCDGLSLNGGPYERIHRHDLLRQPLRGQGFVLTLLPRAMLIMAAALNMDFTKSIERHPKVNSSNAASIAAMPRSLRSSSSTGLYAPGFDDPLVSVYRHFRTKFRQRKADRQDAYSAGPALQHSHVYPRHHHRIHQLLIMLSASQVLNGFRVGRQNGSYLAQSTGNDRWSVGN